MSAVIRQEVEFKASPQRAYDALTDAKHFSAFTGLPAEIHREAGGAFSCFGGQIAGRILDLVPNQRFVQAWRVSLWPEGVFSIARFRLEGGAKARDSFWSTPDFPRKTASISTDGGRRCIGNPSRNTWISRRLRMPCD